MRSDYQRAWEQKRREINGDQWFLSQTWSCRTCGAVFTVQGVREPDTCIVCGDRDVEPDLTGA